MKKQKHNEAFGAVLRTRRMQKGLSQEALAFEAGLDRTYISLLEKGARSPTLGTILALCRALGVAFSLLALEVEAAIESEER